MQRLGADCGEFGHRTSRHRSFEQGRECVRGQRIAGSSWPFAAGATRAVYPTRLVKRRDTWPPSNRGHVFRKSAVDGRSTDPEAARCLGYAAAVDAEG